MAINEDLKKKIADKLANRTPEQKQLGQQKSKESAMRERIRNVSNRSSEFKAPVATAPAKDTTVRLPFSDQRAVMGGDNLLGSFSRFATKAGVAFLESTVAGSMRAVSQIKQAVTGKELNIPGLSISVDLSLGGDNLQKIGSKIPTFSQAAIKRQSELDIKKPDSPYLNTLQAASEEIFLPLMDAVPVLGESLRAIIRGGRGVAISSTAREAFDIIGYQLHADKSITEEGIKAAVKKTARQNIKDLAAGKIKPEEYLAKQTEIGRAVDTLNEGQTRFGRLGSSLNDLTNSLTQERTFGKTTIQRGADGIPVVKAVDESVDTTLDLLKEQNKALRGEMEDMRLSNAKILANAIEDAKLSGEITPDSSIDVFTIGNRQLKPGTRVSLDRETARGIVGNAPRQVGVTVKDLVRLPDGSFAYAPKSMANTGADAISTVRKSVREEITQREKFAQLQKKVRELIEKSKRLADEQEAARVAKEDSTRVARELAQKADAQKIVSNASVDLAKRKANIDVGAAKEVAKIKGIEKVAKATVADSASKVRTAIKNVKAAEGKVKSIEKAIAKAKKEGRATTRLEQTLTKAKADLKNTKSLQRSSERILNKAKGKVPTDTKVKESEIKAKADIEKAKAVDESRVAVKDARATIRSIEDANKVSKPNTRQAERLQNKIDKLKGKKAKLIETYGGFDEVPPSKIKEIDDAIDALKESSDSIKDSPTTKATGGDKATKTDGNKVAKTDNASIPSEKIKPVKIEGTDTKVSTLMDRLNKGLKGVEDSPEFNVATHAKQTENALNYIAKNGIDDTLSTIEKGSFPTGTTKASMVSSLMESIDAVVDPALKLNYTNRLATYLPELSEFGTRAGQEIEALKILHQNNPVMKVMQIQKALNSKGAIEKTAKEVAKLEKQLSKVDTKSIIKEAIDKATCLK